MIECRITAHQFSEVIDRVGEKSSNAEIVGS